MMYGAALLLNVALNLLLIPRMGIVGCALASTVAYTALALGQIDLVRPVSRNAPTPAAPGIRRGP